MKYYSEWKKKENKEKTGNFVQNALSKVLCGFAPPTGACVFIYNA